MFGSKYILVALTLQVLSGLNLVVNGSFTEQCPDISVPQATNVACSGNADCWTVHSDAGTCVVVQGSENCYCSTNKFGYALNQTTQKCDLQIDECACGYSGCLHQCTDLDPATDSTNRRFVCSCNVGYDLLNDFNCIDIDECAANTTVCGAIGSSTCANNDGSYVCTCNAGWTDTGNFCTDIDECDQTPCSHTCTNVEGSFTCSCPTGYELVADNLNCDDTDECEVDTDNCNQTCTNTVGSFECSCNETYFLEDDGYSCSAVNCPENETCSIQYDVRIAISEYWISHLYDNSTETFQHAAKSLESQFRDGFLLNNESWVLNSYKLLRFDLKSSEEYFAYLNITIEDTNATLGGRTDSYIELVVRNGFDTLDTSTYTNKVEVVFETFEILRNQQESINVALTCTHTGMIIHIDESQFTDGVGENNLTLADEACNFTKTGQTWIVEYAYNECGVEREEFPENGTIRYTQYVLYGDTAREVFDSGSNLAWVSARSHIFTLECNYRHSEAFGTELEFFEAEVVEAVGSFNVSLFLYEDYSYGQVVADYPWYVPGDNSQLSFEARLATGDSQLGLYLEECWATPSPDIYDQDKVIIMTNGCAADEDFEWVGQVDNNQAVRFTFVAHKFINLSKGGEALEETYYFCYYELCDQTEQICADSLLPENWFNTCDDQTKRVRRSARFNKNTAGIISVTVAFLPENSTAAPLAKADPLISDVALASIISVVAMITISAFLITLCLILRFQNATFARHVERLAGQHMQPRGPYGDDGNTWGSNSTMDTGINIRRLQPGHKGY